MPDKCTFEYAIIRVVPKVEREEFFNVGVILFSKQKRFLGMKYYIDEQKLAAFSSEISVEFLQDYLSSWEQICHGEPHGGVIGTMNLPSRFRWLSSAKSTIIQCSKTHPGLCNDPAAELEEVFTVMVL